MPATVKSSVELTPSDLEQLHALLNRGEPGLYAILDACDEPSIPIFAEKLKGRAASLYRGKAEQDHAKIAPYIVVVDTMVLDWIHETLWGKPWGFFATAKGDLPTLRRHFRKFLRVEGPEAKELYFRFYDPRVLQPFLESAGPEKLSRFFEPVDDLLIVDADLQVTSIQPKSPGKTLAATSSQRIEFTHDEMRAYADARRAIFARRLLAQILSTLKDLGRKTDQRVIAAHVEEGISRALTYEMNAQCDVARYVQTMCVHLQGFAGDRDPIPIRDLLLDRRVEWAARLDRLDEYAMSNSDTRSAEAT